jgi:hypothetical protein
MPVASATSPGLNGSSESSRTFKIVSSFVSKALVMIITSQMLQHLNIE